MKRETLLATARALEDLMSETAFKESVEDRAIWWACKPLWEGIQKLLRRTT